MWPFDLFRRRTTESDDYYEIEVSDLSMEDVKFSMLSAQDRNRYVEEQCEIILECNNNVDAAKKEYKIVSSYFSDIQIIEAQTEKVRRQIASIAKSIADLSVDRRILAGGEKKLSSSRYIQMQQEEDTMVDSIKNLKNNELYLQIVKKDMSALTGEKAALGMDAKELEQRQRIIKNISIVSLVCFVIIFGVLIAANVTTDNAYGLTFYVVLFFAMLFATGLFVLYRRTIYNMLLTEKKINRAIALHNKVKIKFINVTNLIQYQYQKFGVKSSYELADYYQRYLETKALKQKYRKATMDLSDNEEALEDILDSLGLYDSRIWLSQVKALCDNKEMVEIRHNYSIRRQSLRKYIEENSKRAEDAKALLRKIIEEFPVYAAEVLQIVEKYD